MLAPRLAIALTLFTPLFAQSQIFQDYRYTPPPGYGSRTHSSSIEFFRIDQEKKFYCQIGIYSSQPSAGVRIISPQESQINSSNGLSFITFISLNMLGLYTTANGCFRDLWLRGRL